MSFESDNITGVASAILAALERANDGTAVPYGNDPLTRRVRARIQELFETEADVFLVATGTAANALSLAVMAPPYGAIYCHPESHVHVDECGAPEFYTGGGKLIALPDRGGKIRADDLEPAVRAIRRGVHQVRPAAVSITQATECGTVYTLGEVRAIAAAAHALGLKVHMDGARFANALVGLGCSPADATWRAGVDALSFGATKNGALAAEAAVLFERGLDETFAYRQKRGGHLFSKMRYLAAQFDAYLEDDLWLCNARHANAMATRLAGGLEAVPGALFRYPVEANEIFVFLPDPVIRGLAGDGFPVFRWEGEDSTLVRLVTAFDTEAAEVDGFVQSALRHADASAGARHEA